jgi:gamma-glutamylcysteine synthetase
VNFGHDHLSLKPEVSTSTENYAEAATLTRHTVKPRSSSPQQKTLRLEEDLFQAVKIVAKSLNMTEQDFIVAAIKKETNVHLAAAKELLTAQIASLPSILG